MVTLEKDSLVVNHFVEERFVLTCNGVKVQLNSTGIKGEYVAGIRYKAWNPYSSLHPTIGVDTPLVFDIVDTWNKRSIGGCTYYVAHPGGRSYDSYPINSYEAESRRINRFWDIGHTQGDIVDTDAIMQGGESTKKVEKQAGFKKFSYKELPVNFEFPYTLDLRKK